MSVGAARQAFHTPTMATTEKTDSTGMQSLPERIRKLLRILGIATFLPFLIWLPLGLAPAVPSIVDVFGIDGLKVPAGIVIAGLLMAAVGFEDS